MKLPSLACTSVDFTDKNIKQRGDLMDLNFVDFKMQKWNVPTERVQKMGVIDLVVMFTQEDLSVALKCFVQAVANFLLSSKSTQKSHVLHFNTHNSGSKDDFYHL